MQKTFKITSSFFVSRPKKGSKCSEESIYPFKNIKAEKYSLKQKRSIYTHTSYCFKSFFITLLHMRQFKLVTSSPVKSINHGSLETGSQTVGESHTRPHRFFVLRRLSEGLAPASVSSHLLGIGHLVHWNGQRQQQFVPELIANPLGRETL